ncbi:MAG: hypothetical protein FJ290_05800 [Planctomycetes bacterium]|nr:hypothetical protein [Planctomycetota bacterium]
MQTGICLFLALAAAAETRAAEGWTRFRGPNGSGIAEAADLPVQWAEKDYKWRVKLPGVGHSSPVIWGDKLFLTSGDPKTARRFVLCLKTSDGSTLWQREYESKKHEMNESNSYGTSTPAVDGERVYAYWTTPDEVTLLALTHDGKDSWRRGFGPFASEHGGGTSPIVFEDLVIVSHDTESKSSLFALNRTTGETVWEIKRPKTDVENRASYSTPMVYQPEGGSPQVIFTSRAWGLTAVDPKAGKVAWELRDAFPARCVGSPILAGGLLIAACGTTEPQQVTAVRPPSTNAQAKIAYTVTKYAPYVPTPIAKDDLVFLWGDSGRLACIRAATGEQVWKQRLEEEFYGSPVRVGDRLYCISKKGEVFAIAAGDKYALLGRNPLGEASFATPAVAGRVMYLRTFSHLISIGGK